jgi:hypothetical protein
MKRRAPSKTAKGAIVTRPSFIAMLAEEKQAGERNAAKKVATAEAYWEKHRGPIREAQKELKEHSRRLQNCRTPTIQSCFENIEKKTFTSK